MTKTTSILWIAAALTMSAVPAAAQTTKNIFVDVNLGVQVASRTFVVEASPIVYDETAILSTSHKVGSGVLFDVSGGYRVWRDLSIALGYNYADGSADAQMTAAVPDPLFHDRRVETTTTVDGVKHSENVFHVQAVWTMPVTDKMDASFSFGPSFIHVSQDVVNNITVEPGTQNATPAPETQSDTASWLSNRRGSQLPVEPTLRCRRLHSVRGRLSGPPERGEFEAGWIPDRRRGSLPVLTFEEF